METNLNQFWAKSKDDGAEYMSVLQHSRDISWIIEDVADALLAPATRQFLNDALEGVPLNAVLKLIAAGHDCGKISPFFQQKVPALSQRIPSSVYRSDVTAKQMSANPHSIISAHTLSLWLEKHKGRPLRPTTRKFWFNIIAGHHGVFSEISLPSDDLAREMRIWPEWLEARLLLLDTLAAELDISEETIQNLASIYDDSLDGILPMSAAGLLTGVLISTDWVASAEENFPLTNGEPQVLEERLNYARSTFNLGGHWQPSAIDESGFLERFELPRTATLRNVQKAVIKVGNTQERPSLTIIENETGAGKTEAALALADITAEKLGLNGLFFAQPTRVTSDAIFSRVAQWLSSSDSATSISTVLAHGKAEFNDEFRELTSSDFSPIYDEDSAGTTTQLEATQWFQGKKTGLLASVAVGTIDQILFAVLQSKHNVLRHLGLSGKVVIIDEIHAADAYMRVYTTRLLEWLGVYGVPVIALSATLPPATRQELINAYHRGVSGDEDAVPELAGSGIYPRITWTDGHTTETMAPEHDGLNRTTYFSFAAGDLAEMADKAIELSTNGGCIGIICSTVSRAQELFALISQREYEVVLLHSRFLTADRVQMEADLVRKLGRKAGDDRPRKLIVVSTQIIEQGLDLDFDSLITDIAPTDLIIQRIGRLHRHLALDQQRPAGLKTPRLTIFGAEIPDTSGPTPKIQMGSKRVYRSAPLLHSIKVLADHHQKTGGTISTPGDVEPLVSSSYDDELPPPSEWIAEWEKAQHQESEFRNDQIDRAKHARIPDPQSENLAGWSKQPSLADEQAGVAQVRDADESFEVVVVRNEGGRLYALEHIHELEGVPVDGVMELDRSYARTLATCTVRLPGWSLSDSDLQDLEADGQESWQKSRWLKGALPLVLDDDLSREVDRYIFRYDEHLGLLMERKENITL